MEPGIYLINFVYLFSNIRFRGCIFCSLRKETTSTNEEYCNISLSDCFYGNYKKRLSNHKLSHLNTILNFGQWIYFNVPKTEEIFANRMFVNFLKKHHFGSSRHFHLISYAVTKLL